MNAHFYSTKSINGEPSSGWGLKFLRVWRQQSTVSFNTEPWKMPSHTTAGNTGLDGEAILSMCSIKSASGMNLDFKLFLRKAPGPGASRFSFVLSSLSELFIQMHRYGTWHDVATASRGCSPDKLRVLNKDKGLAKGLQRPCRGKANAQAPIPAAYKPEEPAFLCVHGMALPFAAADLCGLHYVGPVNGSLTEKHTQSFGSGLQPPRSEV